MKIVIDHCIRVHIRRNLIRVYIKHSIRLMELYWGTYNKPNLVNIESIYLDHTYRRTRDIRDNIVEVLHGLAKADALLLWWEVWFL
jgi:hypothetical protein